MPILTIVNGKEGFKVDEKELNRYIGRKIKEFRNKKNLKQSELGAKINVENSTISSYERGIINFNLNTLFALSDALDVKLDDFFPERKTEENYLDDSKELYSNNMDSKDLLFLQKLIEKTASMSEEERKKFMDSIRFTVEYYEKMNQK